MLPLASYLLYCFQKKICKPPQTPQRQHRPSKDDFFSRALVNQENYIELCENADGVHLRRTEEHGAKDVRRAGMERTVKSVLLTRERRSLRHVGPDLDAGRE